MIRRLALGTAQFGLQYGIANTIGQVTPDMARQIMHTAHRNGIDTIDTAMAYGNSEKVLGEIGGLSWRIISKLPDVPAEITDVRGWLFSKVEGSLSRLGVRHLDGLLLHRPGQLLERGGNEIFSALRDCRKAGLSKKIGYSVYDPSELDQLFEAFPPDIVQAPFNVIDRRLVSGGWLGRLKAASVEVHTRSVFLQGLLLMTEAARPKKFCPWDALWGRWHDWLKKNEVTALQACLAFVLAEREIDRVVVGVDSSRQLAEILSAARTSSSHPPDELTVTDEALVNPSLWSRL